MRWDRITKNGSGPVWTIPADDFKGGRNHLVPLSPEAMKIVESIQAEALDKVFVFPARQGTARGHITNLGKPLDRVRKRSGIEHWTMHDFRATFRTHAVRAVVDGGLGVPAHCADAVLGHKEASLGFNRYTGDRDRYMLAEKRDALNAWGAFVRSLVTR